MSVCCTYDCNHRAVHNTRQFFRFPKDISAEEGERKVLAKCGGCDQVFCCSKHRNDHELTCKHFKPKPVFHPSRNSHVNPAFGALDHVNSALLIKAKMKLGDGSNNGRKRQHGLSSSPYPRSSGSSSHSVLIPSTRKYKKAIRGKFRKIQKIPTLESVKEEDEGEEEAKDGDNEPVVLVNGLCEDKPTNSDAYIDFVVGSLNDSPIPVIPSVLLRKDKGVPVPPIASSRMGDNCNEIFKTSTPDPPLYDQPSETPLLKLMSGCKLSQSVGGNLKASTPNEAGYSSGGTVNSGMVEKSGWVELKQEIDAGVTPMTKVQPVQCTDAHPPKPQRFIKSRSFGSKDRYILVTPTTSAGVGDDCNEIFKTSNPDILPSLNDQPIKTPLLKLTFGSKLSRGAVNLKSSTPKETGYSFASAINYGMADESGGVGIKQEIDAGITPMTKVKPLQITPVDAQPPIQQRFIRSRSSCGSNGSSVYYSAHSIISPLALNSHPCTPVTNPSLFTSVKDVFRTFISRLPGQSGDIKMEGITPLESPSTNSPARKRMKKLAESRIECRPTYKGRYKKPASYVFNS